MEKIQIYSNGLIYCSVCAPSDFSREEVERQVNLENPSGVTPWRIDKENFSDGKTNPSPCEKDKGRTHYLMSC